MKGILLDTHAWIWWINDPSKLSRPSKQHIKQAMQQNAIYISAISAWEVTMLVAKKRLAFELDVQDWVSRSEALPWVQFVPIDTAIAVKAAQLKNFHPDPADRLIVATALFFGLSLISKDEKIQRSGAVTTIW